MECAEDRARPELAEVGASGLEGRRLGGEARCRSGTDQGLSHRERKTRRPTAPAQDRPTRLRRSSAAGRILDRERIVGLGPMGTPFLPITPDTAQGQETGHDTGASFARSSEPETLANEDARPLQRKATPADKSGGPDASVRSRAAEGVSGTGTALPHHASIATAFGHHDIGHIQAHVGGAAADAAADIGAEAYATGDQVAFARPPELHTAAHEAAHVVQQRGGVQLKDGVGRAGDFYEQHADAVADRVAQRRERRGPAGPGVRGQPGSSCPAASGRREAAAEPAR